MIYFLRDFELACLVDLVNHVDLKETWYPLYKEWLKNEHSLNINLNITKKWVDNIYKITDMLFIDNYHKILVKYIKDYPIEAQNEIVFSLKLSGLYNL
jgi:hypothetical protein|tara:strand:- start:952 stop:1245 length:294 start_codon:yes stop_codon:yes gene_type:complete